MNPDQGTSSDKKAVTMNHLACNIEFSADLQKYLCSSNSQIPYFKVNLKGSSMQNG